MTDGLQGRRLYEYRKDAAPQRTDRERVQVWLQRIKRARDRLAINARGSAAEDAVPYLLGRPAEVTCKTVRKLYQPYLYPILEDSFARTVPAVPAPQIEPANEMAREFADQARELVATAFQDPRSNVLRSCLEAQWTDAFWGVAFFKTTWRMQYEDALPQQTTDEESVAIQVTDAQMENREPIEARITEGDIHHIHIKIHADHMSALVPEDPDYQALALHIQAHRAAMVQVLREYPRVEVLRTDRFVYDTDNPWADRAWEAEFRSVPIRILEQAGYRNLNSQNLPMEVKPGQTEIAYEDMHAKVWEVHDRRTGDWWIIPASDNRDDGLPLYKGRWPWRGTRGDIDIYLPVVFRPWQLRTNQLHGMATAALCELPLEQLAVVDAAIQRHIEEHVNYKMIVPKGTEGAFKAAMNDPNQRTIPAGPEVIAGMKEYAPPPIPQELLDARELHLRMLRDITGGDPQDTGSDHSHGITATESGRRALMSDQRITDRQEVLGAVLAQVGVNFLALIKEFATDNRIVRIVGPGGEQFKDIDPTDIPDEIGMFVDVRGESEQARAAEYQAMVDWGDRAFAAGYPLSNIEFWEAVARKGGVRRPERFRADEPMLDPGADPAMTPTADPPGATPMPDVQLG